MESELWKVFSDISPFLAHHLMTALDGQVLNPAPVSEVKPDIACLGAGI